VPTLFHPAAKLVVDKVKLNAILIGFASHVVQMGNVVFGIRACSESLAGGAPVQGPEKVEL
jgi:hypothetical protein